MAERVIEVFTGRERRRKRTASGAVGIVDCFVQAASR
jgi:hypothetical protein